MSWKTPVATLLPGFRLGNADTTRSVLVKHLICACTGMPRQDLEWIFEFGKMTPESSLALLGTMQPTSKFGELFQYSNLMAAAAGYTGAHVLYPQMEVGAALRSRHAIVCLRSARNERRPRSTSSARSPSIMRRPHAQDADGKTDQGDDGGQLTPSCPVRPRVARGAAYAIC